MFSCSIPTGKLPRRAPGERGRRKVLKTEGAAASRALVRVQSPAGVWGQHSSASSLTAW